MTHTVVPIFTQSPSCGGRSFRPPLLVDFFAVFRIIEVCMCVCAFVNQNLIERTTENVGHLLHIELWILLLY